MIHFRCPKCKKTTSIIEDLYKKKYVPICKCARGAKTPMEEIKRLMVR